MLLGQITMYAYDTKPDGISSEAWDALWAVCAHDMQKMYEISQELPGYIGKRYDRIDEIFGECSIYVPDTYMAVLAIWIHQILEFYFEEPLTVTPFFSNITRNIVICKV